FGFNILAYQVALFIIWLTTFLFTLLLVDLFFDSYGVTSIAALILNFLPFAFIYTFAGYRYPMATAFAVVSLYFLHLGFKTHLIMLRFIGSGWQPHPSLGRQLLLWSTVFWRPQCRSCSTFFLTGAPTLTTNPALFAISGTHSKRALF